MGLRKTCFKKNNEQHLFVECKRVEHGQVPKENNLEPV